MLIRNKEEKGKERRKDGRRGRERKKHQGARENLNKYSLENMIFFNKYFKAFFFYVIITLITLNFVLFLDLMKSKQKCKNIL